MSNRSYHYRILEKKLLEIGSEFPVLLLTGPRQVGKSTLLKKVDKNRNFITLDNLNDRIFAQHSPDEFLESQKFPLTIDEVQYAPQLFPAIKAWVDKNSKKGQIWLTGSQQFHLMENVVESLAGRVAIVRLHSFNLSEFKNKAKDSKLFDPSSITKKTKSSEKQSVLFNRIWWGGYPALITKEIKNRDVYFDSYIQTYLQKDVRQLLNIAKLEPFNVFLKVLAMRTAQMINYTDLARDCSLSPNTAKAWVSVLESSGVIQLLNPWFHNKLKRVIKTPKLYWLDTGLCAYLCGWVSPEDLEKSTMAGAFFETYVIAELYKNSWYHGKNPKFYYYRDKDAKEIDLLIEQNQTLHPIEIKLGKTPQSQWLKNFGVLENHGIKQGRGWVVYSGADLVPLDKTNWAIPVEALGL